MINLCTWLEALLEERTFDALTGIGIWVDWGWVQRKSRWCGEEEERVWKWNSRVVIATRMDVWHERRENTFHSLQNNHLFQLQAMAPYHTHLISSSYASRNSPPELQTSQLSLQLSSNKEMKHSKLHPGHGSRKNKRRHIKNNYFKIPRYFLCKTEIHLNSHFHAFN